MPHYGLEGYQYSPENAFINKLTGIVLANLRDENFNMKKLSREAGMSHATIHRKLKSTRNQNVSQFIREIRLKKAMEMLQNNEGNVAEIAFRTGFGSSTYFIKCFHEYYGFPPGEARKKGTAKYPDDQIVHQAANQVDYEESESGSALKSETRVFIRRKSFVATFGILSCMLIIYILFVLLKPPQKSIVVLPFENLSDNPENQYLADGIMDGILNNLFRISEMRVISRTSSEYFRDNPMTSPEIGKLLNATYVLEGSVQREIQYVRIFVQLIDARNDQHVLSEVYEGEITNIFAFQSDIAKKVANALRAVISSEELGYIEKIPTINPEAYDNYIKGRFFHNKANDIQRIDISKDGLMTGIRYYEKAIAADSNFVEAYAGLADAWYNLSAWGWYQPYYEGVQKALYFCNRALELDPDCAEAYAVKGVYHMYPELQFEEARRELQKALNLNPNFATAHQWYAQLLMITGPIEEARRHVDRALELEPFFWVMHNLNSWVCYFEEKYKEGLEACFTGLDLNPNSSDNNWLFVLHYVKLGEGEKAAGVLQNIFNKYPVTKPLADEIMKAYNKSGTEGIFRWLIDLNMKTPIPLQGLNGNPYYIAWWYAIIGEREESINWFEKTLETEQKPMHYFNLIANNPDFDILRDDPRFLAVIEKAGLAPYHKRKSR
jgi:TolB-like protein/AraC-like DNA-binding protein